MEFLSQYDHTIIYIKGEDNSVADALSRLPKNIDNVTLLPVATMLAIQSDTLLLKSIIDGYENDPFCIKLKNTEGSIDGVHWSEGLLHIRDCLVIPAWGRYGKICSVLHMTH